MAKLINIFLFLFLILICSSGCSSSIQVINNTESERKNYSVADFSAGTLNGSTINLLNNYQLMDSYKNDPEALIRDLEKLYATYKTIDLVAALADTSLQIGYRLNREEDTGSRYFLAAALYSSLYLKKLDDKENLYNEQRIRMIRICNRASTELFLYLKKRSLERKCGFELVMPGTGGRKIYFSQPVFALPLPEKDIADFSACAEYRTINLTHDTKTFGIGVPLVATLQKNCKDSVGLPLPGFPIAVTLLMDFTAKSKEDIHCTLRYIYSKVHDTVTFGDRKIPLATDFSTPLAKASGMPKKLHFLRRTFRVQEASQITGLYLFEPYDDKRIPVVFVHGLMSDISTWAQMLNTLLHDRVLRKKYQFLGFAYSSGNPVFTSASILRKNLAALRQTLVKHNRSTENFDKMVLVGHSMGGLLSRLQITKCTEEDTRKFFQIKDPAKFFHDFSGDELASIKEKIVFCPAPFVKRVIFIAVPHKGSEIARSWIGSMGASLINLPVNLVKINVKLMKKITGEKKNIHPHLAALSHNTGIDNLRPDSPILLLMNQLKMAEIPYHSIIGNNKKAFTPGGTDGVVPYWSSHLDKAVSELIVESGHSAHRSPLAIQEVRQILLAHAKNNEKK